MTSIPVWVMQAGVLLTRIFNRHRRGAGLSPRFDQRVVDFGMYPHDLNEVVTHYLETKRVESGVTESQVYLMGWSLGATLSTRYVIGVRFGG